MDNKEKMFNFLPNKDFNTIIIDLLFPIGSKKENMMKSAMLTHMLQYMNNIYPTEEEFIKAKKLNYILKINVNVNYVGNNGFLIFTMTIPDEFSLGEDLLLEQIDFLKDVVYNPKVIDGCFDRFEFEREKKNILLNINNINASVDTYHNYKLLKLVDDEGIISCHLNDYADEIKELSSKDLYSYYKEKVSNMNPLIYVMGNVDEIKIRNLLLKDFYDNSKNDAFFVKDVDCFLDTKEDVRYVNDETNFKESVLSLVYKVKDMSVIDKNYLDLIASFLRHSAVNLLKKKLRDEMDLIYYSIVISNKDFGLLRITVYINKNNKDVAYQKILEIMEEIKDRDLIENSLNKLISACEVSLIKNLDNKYSIFNDFIDSDLGLNTTLEERYELLKSVKADDVINFINRLSLDTVYFTEEENHE